MHGRCHRAVRVVMLWSCLRSSDTVYRNDHVNTVQQESDLCLFSFEATYHYFKCRNFPPAVTSTSLAWCQKGSGNVAI